MFCRHAVRLTNYFSKAKPVLGHFPESRNIKRWVAPTLQEINRRKKRIPPEAPQPRSTFLEWNYDVELHCFGNRLGEKFDDQLLREALTQREYANLQEFKSKEEGNEDFVPEPHNYELANEGQQIISDYIKAIYSKSYPDDIVIAVQKYLTTDEMLAHVAKYLGMTDLVKAAEFPVETRTLADVFRATVGALASSTNEERAQIFVKDFVIAQMNGKDVYDIWMPERPYDYLMKLLSTKGVKEVEPRLCNQSAVNTILANYQVGLYDGSNQKLLGIGWGETVQIAKDTAALDAIQKIYNDNVQK